MTKKGKIWDIWEFEYELVSWFVSGLSCVWYFRSFSSHFFDSQHDRWISHFIKTHFGHFCDLFYHL